MTSPARKERKCRVAADQLEGVTKGLAYQASELTADKSRLVADAGYPAGWADSMNERAHDLQRQAEALRASIADTWPR